MKNIIEVNNLSKSYKEIKAVRDISFSVREGEIFAFLGLNGAGKSTTINIIAGVLAKDSGQIIIDGIDQVVDMQGTKRKIGIVFQSSVLDKLLSVKDNLKSRAGLYGITSVKFEQRLSELATLLDFMDLLNRPINKLSGGQQRRIDIARALIHQPSVLILDEPTTGLDPKSRILVWDVINKLRREENLTVMLTTHYMEEASDADFVIIIDEGIIVARDTPLGLKQLFASDFIKLYFTKKNKQEIENSLQLLKLNYREEFNHFKIEISNPAAGLKIITENIKLFTDFEIVKGKMDDVFLKATGKRAQQ